MLKERIALFTDEDREHPIVREWEHEYRIDPDYVMHPWLTNPEGDIFYIHKDKVASVVAAIMEKMAIERIVEQWNTTRR